MVIVSQKCIGWLTLASLLLASAREVGADDRSAASLFPETTLVFAEIPAPEVGIHLFRSHPLRRRLEALQGVQKAYKSQDYLNFQAALSLVEAQLGETWPQLLQTATAGGVGIGLDAATGGLALLVKAEDEQTLPKLLDSLAELARADAERKNRANPIKQGEYRGIAARQIDRLRLATFGPWLLATNKPQLGEDILDRYLDATEDHLQASDRFRRATRATEPDATAWSYVDLAGLRRLGVGQELFGGKTGNPLAELLVGGLLDLLKHAPHATATLRLNNQHARLQLAVPYRPAWVSQKREYFFGPNGSGAAPAVTPVDNQLGAISTYRDLSAMWLQAGDLLQPSVVDKLAEADGNLSTLFSGKDFGEEILGAVDPEVQLVVARQTFQADQPQPAIKLPAVAAIFRLKDPDRVTDDFRRTFQSLIGFVNILGAMKGQPQLDLDLRPRPEGQLVTATYVVNADADGHHDLKIHYNFSPSIALVGDFFVVSSTKQLADKLAGAVAQQPAGTLQANTRLQAEMRPLHALLQDNREQLIAQNMLSEGHTRDEAEADIGDLLSLVESVSRTQLELRRHGQQMQLAVELEFTP